MCENAKKSNPASAEGNLGCGGGWNLKMRLSRRGNFACGFLVWILRICADCVPAPVVRVGLKVDRAPMPPYAGLRRGFGGSARLGLNQVFAVHEFDTGTGFSYCLT